MMNQTSMWRIFGFPSKMGDGTLGSVSSTTVHSRDFPAGRQGHCSLASFSAWIVSVGASFSCPIPAPVLASCVDQVLMHGFLLVSWLVQVNAALWKLVQPRAIRGCSLSGLAEQLLLTGWSFWCFDEGCVGRSARPGQTFQQITKTLESLRSFAFARRPGIGLGYWTGWAVTQSPDTSVSHPPSCSMENKPAGSARGAGFSQMLKHLLRSTNR